MKIIKAFLADETGATAIEYGLIAAGDSPCNYRRRQWAWCQAKYQVHFDQQFTEVARTSGL